MATGFAGISRATIQRVIAGLVFFSVVLSLSWTGSRLHGVGDQAKARRDLNSRAGASFLAGLGLDSVDYIPDVTEEGALAAEDDDVAIRQRVAIAELKGQARGYHHPEPLLADAPGGNDRADGADPIAVDQGDPAVASHSKTNFRMTSADDGAAANLSLINAGKPTDCVGCQAGTKGPCMHEALPVCFPYAADRAEQCEPRTYHCTAGQTGSRFSAGVVRSARSGPGTNSVLGSIGSALQPNSGRVRDGLRPSFVIVTGASAGGTIGKPNNHECPLMNQLNALAKFAPDVEVIIYDLGIQAPYLDVRPLASGAFCLLALTTDRCPSIDYPKKFNMY